MSVKAHLNREIVSEFMPARKMWIYSWLSGRMSKSDDGGVTWQDVPLTDEQLRAVREMDDSDGIEYLLNEAGIR